MQNGYFTIEDTKKQFDEIAWLMEHIQEYMTGDDPEQWSEVESLRIATAIYTANLKAGWLPRDI